MLTRTFTQLATITMLFATCFASSAHADVPPHIEQCIKDRAPNIATMSNRETAWQRFYHQYADRDLIGRMAFGAYWKGFNDDQKLLTLGHFFDYLYQARKTSGDRHVESIEIKRRPLPDHAYRNLIHVHVKIIFADNTVSRFNLLGTENCKLVDASDGNFWIIPRLDLGLIEHATR